MRGRSARRHGRSVSGRRACGRPRAWLGSGLFDPTVRTDIDNLTDGEWVWPGHALHYAETYSIVPPDPDFLNKVRSCGGVCPFPTDDELHEVGAACFAGCDDASDSVFGAGVEKFTTVDVGELDVDDTTGELRMNVGDVEWALDRLKAVVEPAMALGKTQEYFDRRDHSEGLSGERTYSAIYRKLCWPGGAIVVRATADGRLRVVRGGQWVTTAQAMGIAELPVTRQ